MIDTTATIAVIINPTIYMATVKIIRPRMAISIDVIISLSCMCSGLDVNGSLLYPPHWKNKANKICKNI
jgi:hypothetical protein